MAGYVPDEDERIAAAIADLVAPRHTARVGFREELQDIIELEDPSEAIAVAISEVAIKGVAIPAEVKGLVEEFFTLPPWNRTDPRSALQRERVFDWLDKVEFDPA